ncbi:TPA: DUF551 domain-containing protein [Klebsiella pneumoniae]|nr:DUF551 domain-containing protein [Klebsiella pneumoniae]
MTKSTITREQLLEIIETDHVQCGEASYLARMALAAMASEHKRNPVLAYADSYRDMANQGVESVPIWSVITDLERNIAPLYRHAQPAPVVEREPIAWLNDAYLARGVVDGEAGSEDAGPGYIPVYREAGPQPSLVVPDDVLDALQKVARIRLDLNDFDGDRRGIADCLCDAEEALIEVVNRCAAMLAAYPQSPGGDHATVPGKWIPVSERIPDNTEPVLCIEKRADFGTYGQPFVCWHDGGGWVGKTNYRPIVTHWMPLPNPPKE